MGLISLVRKTLAPVIGNEWYNDFLDALADDIIGRNTSGVPTAGKNLGSSLYPFGQLFVDRISLGGSLVDFSDQESSPYKIVSGKKRSGSNQPQFLAPSGAGATATLQATSVNLAVEINGTSYTISADVSMTGLTLAPSSNNTALVNESTAADQAATRLWGENNPRLTDHPILAIDTAGSEVTALVGQYVCLKLDNGSVTEYLLGFLKSTTELIDVRRGYFTDSSGNPKNRIVFSNNDTLTLMKLAWVFAKSDGTVDVSYKNPSVSAAEPAGPVTNDYWYDLANQLWKQYDGASFVEVARIPIGVLVLDSTNCVAARSFDFFASVREENTLELEYLSASTVRSKGGQGVVGVMGNKHRFLFTRPTWDMASHLAGSTDMYDATEQASRTYYLYVTDEGAQKISDIEPYWRAEFGGWYHPHLPWRLVGQAYNNSSSNLESASVISDSLIRAPFEARRYSTLGAAVPVGGYGLTAVSFSRANTAYGGSTGSIQITTLGRPVKYRLVPRGGDGYVRLVASAGPTVHQGYIRLLRDGTPVQGELRWSEYDPDGGAAALDSSAPLGMWEWTDTPPPGTYTYTIEVKTNVGTVTFESSNAGAECYEL